VTENRDGLIFLVEPAEGGLERPLSNLLCLAFAVGRCPSLVPVSPPPPAFASLF